MISCMASRILAVAAAATLLSLCVMVASSGVDAAAVPDPLPTLTLCVGEDLKHVPPSPFHSDFVGIIRQAVEAANSSVDRSSSHLFSPVAGTGDYALAQCRVDVPADECSRCLAACTGAIRYTCDSATVRYGVCLLSFGKRNLSAFDANQQMASAYDVRGSRPTNLTEDVAVGLLTTVAANATANAASRTAAGIAEYRDTAGRPGGDVVVGSVYGLAQCTTQMSAPDCGRCLRDVLVRFSMEFNASAGMQVVSASCMVQYASSLFFNASLLPVTHVSVPDGGGAPPPAGSTSVPHGGSARVIALSAGLGGGLAALAVAALVTSWFIRRSGKSKSPAGGGNYSYQTLLDATGNFSEENKLGSGGCGVVYKGILENKQEIAVKKLARKELKELEREVCLVAELQHENLVKFLGHCYQEAEMFLVYEYLRNKCLSNYFKGSVGCEKLDWPKWLNIIRGIARGLCYLHRDSGKDIVHRDLKPSNVLLDSNFAAKIADFDLARGFNRERSHESTQNTAGTYGYIAPECYAEGKFCTKSDVYSYGVMVLEIIVGRSIGRFESENCTGLVEHVWQHWRELRVGDVLDRDHLGLASHEQMQQAARCVQVALLCVQNDRSRRPAMDEAVHFLSGEMDKCLPDPCAPGYVSSAPAPGHSVNGVTISVLEPRSWSEWKKMLTYNSITTTGFPFF